MRAWLCMLPLMTALLTAAPAGALPLDELVRRADMVLRGKTSAGVLSMEIKTRSYHRSFDMVIWTDSHGDERTLVKILGPALWRGHGTLKVGSQLKLYNPRSDHVTVVSHSMLGDNWMGSHFTNDDLVKETQLAKHYHQRLARTYKGKNEQGQEVTLHVIRLTPRPTAPVPWGLILFELWERQGVVMPVKLSYMRKASSTQPERILTFSDVAQIGGRIIPRRMVMEVTRKPGEHTSITYKKIKFDIRIPDGKFTEQALRH